MINRRKKAAGWLIILFLLQMITIFSIFAAFMTVQKISEIGKKREAIKKAAFQAKEKIIYELEDIHRITEFTAWNYGVVTDFKKNTADNSENLKRVKLKIMTNEISHWLGNLKINGAEVGIADISSGIVVYSDNCHKADIEKIDDKSFELNKETGETRDYFEIKNGRFYIKGVAEIDENGRLIVKKRAEKVIDDSKESLKEEFMLVGYGKKEPVISSATIFDGTKRIAGKSLKAEGKFPYSNIYKRIKAGGKEYEFYFVEILDSSVKSAGSIGSGYILSELNSKYSIFKVKFIIPIVVLSLISAFVLVIAFDKIFRNLDLK